MGKHVHIVRIEQERALVRLLQRHGLIAARFLHDLVPPAAGLRAFAVVGVAPGQIVRDDAPAGKGHTDRTVHERFQLQRRRRFLADLAHFF